MTFNTKLIITPIYSNYFQLHADLIYVHENITTTIPAGMITDFASIPKPLRILFDVNGSHREEAVLHDYLYIIARYNGKRIKRKEADQIFLEALSNDPDVGWWKSRCFYRAIRLGGWVAWNRHRRSDA